MKRECKWYSIRPMAAASRRSAEVFIYGDIGESWFGDTVAAKDFVREIAALDVEALTVRINSFGGSVTDGIAIYNALKRHAAEVTVSIDGMAASIASLIAMAGDRVEMAANALLMVHAPWSVAVGNSTDLRDHADLLDTFADAMATSYAAKTGRPVAEMRDLLTDGQDHWYGADDALEAKFVDEVVDALPIAASLRFDASRFRSLPAQLSGGALAAAAAFPQKEKLMDKQQGTTTAAAEQPARPATVSEDDIRAQALAADTRRRVDIRAAFAPFAAHAGVSGLREICENDVSITPDVAAAKLLEHLGRNASPVMGADIVMGDAPRDKFRAGATTAILARAGLGSFERSNEFNGYTLYELARASLERCGVKTAGRGKMEVVAAAFTHSGSDFPNLLANIAEKAMLKGYEEAEETFQSWTSKGNLPDFKQAKRVDLNTFPALDQVPDGGEYKYATIGERGETIQLATYGKMFSITRQAIINDDLDAFSKIPRRMGRSAVRTVGNLVYAVLTGNPTMADGVALFHATHANLPTGAVISTTSVDAMRVAMGKQTDGVAAALNIRLSRLIVPIALEGTAKVVATSEFEVGASTKNNTVPNSVRGTFQVVSDARLDVASAAVWYGAGDPAMHDTVEVAYLDGVETPTLEQQSGWTVDGVEFKVRLDAGVKALDHRALAKNVGA
jgi:ATP-dependent protease ClpP protease subunit